MGYNQEMYICKTGGFSIKGFPKGNTDINRMVRVKSGDVVSSDSNGYLWKDGICVCHKDSILGKYHFLKISKK